MSIGGSTSAARPGRFEGTLGEEPFDLVVCCHVLEHTRLAAEAARNIERVLRPGGLAYVATPWSQAFHATPDDYWRFSVRGLMLLFDGLEILSSFYSGGDVGLDVAYRVERDGRPELESGAGAVEQGLFQLVLDHEDNRAVLARQATERLPVSRTYLPTLFVNLVGSQAATNEKSGLSPALSDLSEVLRLEAQVHAEHEQPTTGPGAVDRALHVPEDTAAGQLDAGSEGVVDADLELVRDCSRRRRPRPRAGSCRSSPTSSQRRRWSAALVVPCAIGRERARAVAVVGVDVTPAERHLPRTGFVHDRRRVLAGVVVDWPV